MVNPWDFRRGFLGVRKQSSDKVLCLEFQSEF
jgi:hypothetical protein